MKIFHFEIHGLIEANDESDMMEIISEYISRTQLGKGNIEIITYEVDINDIDTNIAKPLRRIVQ